MIRILYISSSGERGGAEVVLLSILAHLDRSRFHPEVVFLQDGDLVRVIREQTSIAAITLPAGRFRDLLRGSQVVRGLQRVIRDLSIDIVHSNGTGAHVYGGLAACRCGVPGIYHLHDVPERSWTRQGLLQRAANHVPASAVVAVSRFIADHFEESTAAHRQVHIIHNAVSFDEGVNDLSGNGVRESFGWSPDAPVAIWLGRLQRWKGTHIFLEAAAQVRQCMPATRFLVVGGELLGLEPGYPRELHELAERLELTECLRFTGYRRDVRPLMLAADVVVHSSIRPEPFGMVVLEAMSLGKAVVASAAGGPVELIVPGETGTLVTPGHADELAHAVLRLLGDKPLRQSMGRAARERVADYFTMPQMMKKVEDLYETLVAPTEGIIHDVNFEPPREAVFALSHSAKTYEHLG
jgi:glycosyltransferase involved in cell wall biosynthesis